MSNLIETKRSTLSLLEELKGNLNRISTESEQGFLDLGSSLQKTTQEGKGVGEKVQMILDLAESDLGQDMLSRLENLTQSSYEYFNDKRTAIMDNSQMLNTLTGSLTSLRKKNDQIEQMAKYLRAVALNIFIETSRSRELSESFSIIAEEIKQLSEHILTLSKHVRESVGDSETRLHSMENEIRQGIIRLEQLTGDTKTSFESAINQTVGWLSKAKQLAGKNIEIQRRIMDRVGAVVMSLQFQDAMRQRLEHIVANLVDMEGMLTSMDADDESASGDTATKLYVLSALLVDQVEAIIQESTDVYFSCLSAFGDITTNMIEIEIDVKGMMRGQTKKAETPSKKGETKVLLIESLQEFLSVKNEGNELSHRMKEIYDMASETSSTLKGQVGQIHQISMDAHIKALNAIIAATHLGTEGKTLSVLAGEMKSLSDLTDTFVSEVNVILEGLVEGSRIDDQDLKNGDEYEASLEEMVNTVPQMVSEVISHFIALNKLIKEVKATHDTTQLMVAFIPDVTRGLESQKEILVRVKSMLEPHRKEGAKGHEISAMIKERYTMEREREIHRQSLDVDGDTPSQDHGVETEGEFEDNIELF